MTWDNGHLKQVEFFAAIASCTLSFLVLLTCVVFRMWNKLFMRIIFYISLSDFIANATVFSGTPTDFYLCFLQGFLQQIFYPASWFWTAILSYFIYSLVMYEKIEFKEWQTHVVSWGVPLLFALLPLSTDAYRNSSEDDDFCWIQPRSGNSSLYKDFNLFWQVLTFGAMIFSISFIMIVWGCIIYRKLQVEKVQCPVAVLTAVRALLLYPILLVCCWLPNAIQLNAFPQYEADSSLVVALNTLSILHGGLAALVFFKNSREARDKWKAAVVFACGYCFCCCCDGQNAVGNSFSNDNSSSNSSNRRRLGENIGNLELMHGTSTRSDDYSSSRSHSALNISSSGNGSTGSITAAASNSNSSSLHGSTSSASRQLQRLLQALSSAEFDFDDDDAYRGNKPFATATTRTTTTAVATDVAPATTSTITTGTATRSASEVPFSSSCGADSSAV